LNETPLYHMTWNKKIDKTRFIDKKAFYRRWIDRSP